MRGVITILVFSFVMFSCSKTEEELRKKEQEKLDVFMTKTSLTFYKAIKVAMKMSAVTPDDPELAAAVADILRLGLRRDSLVGDSTQSIGVSQLVSMTHDFYVARNILSKKDEDDLPTVLDNIRVMYGAKVPVQPLKFGSVTYDNNFEHTVLGLFWTASVKAPVEFTLYELHKAEASKVPAPYIKLMTELSKSLAYSTNSFPWHALDQSAGYLSNLEANQSTLQLQLVGLTEESTAEQRFYQHHLMGKALHGLAHLKLEHDKESMTDFEVVIVDAEKGGLDNELVWLIQSYVSIKNEDNEKAIEALDKLEHSALMSESERDAIRDAKEYLSSRKSEKAFNSLRDKIAVSKIGFKLIVDRLKDLEQVKQLRSTTEGASMVAIQKKIEDNSTAIVQMVEVDADSLVSKTKSGLKRLIGQ